MNGVSNVGSCNRASKTIVMFVFDKVYFNYSNIQKEISNLSAKGDISLPNICTTIMFVYMYPSCKFYSTITTFIGCTKLIRIPNK